MASHSGSKDKIGVFEGVVEEVEAKAVSGPGTGILSELESGGIKSIGMGTSTTYGDKWIYPLAGKIDGDNKKREMGGSSFLGSGRKSEEELRGTSQFL